MTRRYKPLPDYGYRLNINEPEVHELFQRYKKWKGIPVWCPLSDAERHEFEFMILRARQKKAERES